MVSALIRKFPSSASRSAACSGLNLRWIRSSTQAQSSNVNRCALMQLRQSVKVEVTIQPLILIPQSHSIQMILLLTLKKDKRLGLRQRLRNDNTNPNSKDSIFTLFSLIFLFLTIINFKFILKGGEYILWTMQDKNFGAICK